MKIIICSLDKSENMRNKRLYIFLAILLAITYAGLRQVTILLAGYDGSNSLVVTWAYIGEDNFYITGRVADDDNNPISGVTIHINNGITTTTDSIGYFTFTNLITGTYTITPVFIPYSFVPDMRVVSVPPNAIGQDFTAIQPTTTPTTTPASTLTSTSSPTPTSTSSPTPTRTPLSDYLSIVIKPIPPTPTPTRTPTQTNTPQPPIAPYLKIIDNSDQDNYYTVSWGDVYDADLYMLEESTDLSFNNPRVTYQGINLSWTVQSPGKTPATYYYRVEAMNIGGASTGSNIQQVTIYPLFVSLNLRWDGMGYIRGSEYYDIGYHWTIVIDNLSQGYILRSNNNAWYDPNPNGWLDENWFCYYSVLTGEFLSCSIPPDPSWKWGNSWKLSYYSQFYDGQTVYIDSQAFIVSGPHSGYTAFGVPVQYWELMNKNKFLYWDGGGDWKQYVHAGDVVLRYDAGNTGLELYSNVLRHYYYQGDPTSDTVQYIINLTAANSFPQNLSWYVPSSILTQQSDFSDWYRLDKSKLPGPQY